MRQFASPGFKFRAMPAGMKIVYTIFLGWIFVGYGTNFALQYAASKFTCKGFVEYYRGNIDAEDDGNLSEDFTIREPKQAYELLLLTHNHLFIMPVVYLILVHMFFFSEIFGTRMKVAATLIPSAGITLDVACPWLIRFVAPGFAALKLFSVFLMVLTVLFLVIAPVYEMWLYRGKAPDVT
ncbi:MAG: hypothetical protein QGG53_19935 [Planctomycetota bacterium]|jgi:hypothetical protein|nr:hypothetical protein [Planctomycetota bacterium]